MTRTRARDRVILAAILVAVTGVSLLAIAIAWLLWQGSREAEREHASSLAERVGLRAEQIIIGTRDLLQRLDRSDTPRCGPAHLDQLEREVAARPYIRAIGHWRAAERRCGVGLVQGAAPTPVRADRLYPSGVLAWWPGESTAIGGVPMFLMRYGDHDAAIDPRLLIEVDPQGEREAALWVEGMRLSASRLGGELPAPGTVPPGLTLDFERGRLLSRFSVDAVLPIDVVAVEPIGGMWRRQLGLLIAGAVVGIAVLLGWLWLVLRYSRRRLGMAQQLRHALARGEIRVHYQPVVDLASGRCVGAEALARWLPPGGDPVSPDVFVPVAESAGLAHALTCAVLRNVLEDCAALMRGKPAPAINVNLSPDDLVDGRLQKFAADLLAAHQVPAACIKFEITERNLINSDVARAQIRGFRANGHQVAVDDFGTGYSSLAYLQSFELDVLKIDRIFVESIDTQSATREVVPHLIAMAQDLGLDVVAEGVQSPAQVNWLVQHGVHYGQGYLFGQAVVAEDFAKLFRESGRREATRGAPGDTW